MNTVWKIYETVTGQVLPEYAHPIGDDLFAPGKPCEALYEQARAAGQRICHRLGASDEDHDVEEIFTSMDQICRMVAFEMFRCGVLSKEDHPYES